MGPNALLLTSHGSHADVRGTSPTSDHMSDSASTHTVAAPLVGAPALAGAPAACVSLHDAADLYSYSMGAKAFVGEHPSEDACPTDSFSMPSTPRSDDDEPTPPSHLVERAQWLRATSLARELSMATARAAELAREFAFVVPHATAGGARDVVTATAAAEDAAAHLAFLASTPHLAHMLPHMLPHMGSFAPSTTGPVPSGPPAYPPPTFVPVGCPDDLWMEPPASLPHTLPHKRSRQRHTTQYEMPPVRREGDSSVHSGYGFRAAYNEAMAVQAMHAGELAMLATNPPPHPHPHMPTLAWGGGAWVARA